MVEPASPQTQAVIQQQMESPAPGVGIFNLPTGLFEGGNLITEVQLREISGVEEDLLLAKSGSPLQKFNTVLTNCIVRIGSITSRETIARLALDMRTGDRSFLLICLRRVSLGDEYPFEFKCENDACAAKSTQTVNLADLETFQADEPAKMTWEFVLPSKRVAVVKVATGHLEMTQDKVGKTHSADAVTRALATRLESLNGASVTIPVIQQMPIRDRDALRGFFDKIDGGIETTVEVACPVCKTEVSVEVDPGTAGFFFPSALKKRSKPKSAS